MMGRQPLGPASNANSSAWSAAPFGSPAKLGLGEEEEELSISPESVAKNAARVIAALEAESPPEHSQGIQNGGEHTPTEHQAALALVPAGSITQCQPVDTVLIRRLASEVAADTDVVAAWEEAEGLRQQLRLKDAELQSALEALAAAQAFCESPRSLQRHQETAGQQLARFLKDQLSMRDQGLAEAQGDAAELRQQLERRSEQLAATEQALAERQAALTEAQQETEALRCQQAGLQQELAAARVAAEEHAEAASYARLEAEEARREAAAQVQQLQSELWAVEARANLAAYNTPGAGSSWQEHEGSISLQQPGTAYHSVGDEVAVHGPAPAAGEEEEEDDEVEDVFSSPVLSSLRASVTPRQHLQQQQQQLNCAAGSAVGFQFAASASCGHATAQADDDASSSSGESEVTVSEAAVVARTLTRASALQKDREHLQQQVQDLSQELRDLKGKQKNLAKHMQAAHSEGGSGSARGASVGRPQQQPVRRLSQQKAQVQQRVAAAAHSMAGGDAALAEKCRLAVVEERHLRSEVDMLNRKCEKGNEMLLKANHAMKILHYKLQKERKGVARLQDEKCALQAQLLSGGAGAGGDPRQLAAMLQELQTGRARIEGLLEEKAALAAKLEAVATGGCSSSREQREAAAATMAALQHQQEATTAALREELAVVRARAAVLGEERGVLEGRLQEALGRLTAAEQISGHLEQMNAYLQEERQRCQQLASQLGREQQGSESAAAEVAHLSALAQQSVEDVMVAREAVQQERSRAEQLLREKAELQGKVEVLQETLQRLETEDNVLLRLTEDKAALQMQLKDSQAAAERGAVAVKERSRQAAEMDATCRELRSQLDAARTQHDVAHAAVEGAADQLQALTDSHEALEHQLAVTSAELDVAQGKAVQHAQHAQQLEQRTVSLEAELRQGLQLRDTALAQLQDLHRQLGAVQQEAAAQRQMTADKQQRLEAAAAEHEDLATQLRGLEAENANLKDNLQALEAECEAVRRLGSSVDQTNQALVDNMCDMSGLVDAVQALQQRNRLLQQDLDTLKAKYAELHRNHEGQSHSLHATREELAAEAQQRKELQAAHAELQQGASMLRADLMAAQAQRDQAMQQHKEAERELGGLRERMAAAAASLAESRKLAEQAQQQYQEAAAAVAELRQQLAEAQQLVAVGNAEKAEWGERQSELQGQLAALQQAQLVAEGKLVLARQRDAQFKEASKQLKVLQQELKAFVAESQAHRQKHEEAERQCEMLEARCLALEWQVQRVGEQLAVAEEEREAAGARQAVLQEQLADAQLGLMQLEAQQETFQSVQQRLSELETEQHTSAEWFDALTSELTDKTDQLTALEMKLQAAGKQQAHAAQEQVQAAAQLADVQQQLAAMAAGQQAAEEAHAESSLMLEQTQQQLAKSQVLLMERQEQLDAAEAVAAEVSVQIVMVQAGKEAAEIAMAEAQQTAQLAQHECCELHQQLAAMQASSAAAQGEQQERIKQLYRGMFVMAAVHMTGVRELQAAAAAACEGHTAALSAAQEEHAAALAAVQEQHAGDLAAAGEQYTSAMAAAREQHAAALAAAQEQYAVAAAEAEQRHRQEAAGLQASLADLSAQLDAAIPAQQVATERCVELDAELAAQAELIISLEQQLSEAKAKHAAVTAAQVATERQHQLAAADSATHERHVQQLEQQCSVLREQLAFLHEQRQTDSGESETLKAAAVAATAESRSLQQQLAEAWLVAEAATTQQQRLQHELEEADEVQQAAQQREVELRLELAASAAAAERAQQEAGVVEGQANHLRQQLEVEEERRRELEQQLDEAGLERERLLAKAQVRDMLEGLSGRLQSQMELLQRIEHLPLPPAAGKVPQALSSRRELLVQTLEKLQTLKTENQQLWRMLEEHLSASSPADGTGSGRANQYVAHLESEREQLVAQLAAVQQEQAEAAARLAAAQAAISKLQAVVQRLAAAGGAGGGLGWDAELALLGPPASPGQPASLPSLTAAFEQRQHFDALSGAGATPQHSGLSNGSGAAGWQAEKRLLKAVCKLALAVTMDQVGGRQEAASLARELEPLMAAQAATLRTLGLHKVWTSLHKLALAGGGTSSTTGRTEQQQQQAAEEVPQDVWALRQQVQQYKVRCRELKATVVAMEGAAARWQSQAGEVEQGLALLRFRLADLLSEVKWVLQDYSEAEGGTAGAAGEGGTSSQQLAQLVEQLGKGLRRILRKYKMLAGHLHHDGGSSQQRYQQQQQQEEATEQARRRTDGHHHHQAAVCHSGEERHEVSGIDDGGCGGGGAAHASANQGSSWATGTERQASSGSVDGPSSSYSGAVCEAMAEAGRKAASIAAKLDRLLTPQSRAAVHGTHGGMGWRSRFAAPEAAGAEVGELEGEEGESPAAEQEEEGCSHQHRLHGGFDFDRLHQQQLWLVPAGDPEEVPLRQRYGSALPPF